MSAVHLDRGDGTAACGAPNAARAVEVTADPGAVDCGRCNRWTWNDVRPHGTLAACRRHYRHGEQPCGSSRQAQSRYLQDSGYNARRRENYRQLRDAGESAAGARARKRAGRRAA